MGQLSAVTGRKVKPNYVSRINAQVGYLPSYYRAKLEKDTADKEYEQSQEYLDLMAAAKNREYDIAEEGINTSNAMGMANLGTTLMLGSKRSAALDEVYNAADAGKETAGKTNWFAPSVVDTGTGAGEMPAFFSSEGLSATGEWTNALKDLTPYTSALIGATAGKNLGEKVIPIGSKKTKGIIGSAATSAGLSYLMSGGNPYVTAVSTIVGGGLGGIF